MFVFQIIFDVFRLWGKTMTKRVEDWTNLDCKTVPTFTRKLRRNELKIELIFEFVSQKLETNDNLEPWIIKTLELTLSVIIFLRFSFFNDIDHILTNRCKLMYLNFDGLNIVHSSTAKLENPSINCAEGSNLKTVFITNKVASLSICFELL